MVTIIVISLIVAVAITVPTTLFCVARYITGSFPVSYKELLKAFVPKENVPKETLEYSPLELLQNQIHVLGAQGAIIQNEEYFKDDLLLQNYPFMPLQLRQIILSSQTGPRTPHYLQKRALNMLATYIKDLDGVIVEYLELTKAPTVHAEEKDFITKLVFRFAKTEHELKEILVKVPEHDYLHKTAVIKLQAFNKSDQKEAKVIQMAS